MNCLTTTNRLELTKLLGNLLRQIYSIQKIENLKSRQIIATLFYFIKFENQFLIFDKSNVFGMRSCKFEIRIIIFYKHLKLDRLDSHFYLNFLFSFLHFSISIGEVHASVKVA